MDLREMATDRLVTVSVRLLAAASVLTTAAIAFSTWNSWQQVGQSYSPDGNPEPTAMPFGTKISATVLEYSYRPGGLQLLMATVLMAGAVMALHLHRTRSRVRYLRWEVLGAGLVPLVAVTLFSLANVFVLAAPADANEENWLGPQPIAHVALANLGLLAAGLLMLLFAALWWLGLGTSPDHIGDDRDEGGDESAATDDENHPQDVDQTDPGALIAVNGSPDRLAHGTFGQPTHDYSRDWSPEDFLPPR